MILVTPNLIIAPMAYEDLAVVWRWKTGKEGRAMHTLVPIEASYEAFCGDFWHAQRSCQVACMCHAKGTLEPVGAFWGVQFSPHYPELLVSVIFSAKAQGSGIPFEAGMALVGHFVRQGARRLAVYIDERNRPAARLARQLGFGQEGLMCYPGKASVGIWAFTVDGNESL